MPSPDEAPDEAQHVPVGAWLAGAVIALAAGVLSLLRGALLFPALELTVGILLLLVARLQARHLRQERNGGSGPADP